MKAEIYSKKWKCADGCCSDAIYTYTVWDKTGKVIVDTTDENFSPWFDRDDLVKWLMEIYPGITIID